MSTSPIRPTGKGKNIRRIVIHCTATREGQDIDAATIRRWHLRQGWSDIGYHFVIGIDGEIERGRPEEIAGSHVRGFNTGSIGVVYVGGLDAQGKGKDTRTPAQQDAMAQLVRDLLASYPGAEVVGHRDLSPDRDGDGVVERHEWLKECPCFDVRSWWAGVR
jgi:N-acetyl-anhydromuramyl-L-alanine amidase AmpD